MRPLENCGASLQWPQKMHLPGFVGFVLIAKHQPDEAIPLLEKAALASDRSPRIIGGLVSDTATPGDERMHSGSSRN